MVLALVMAGCGSTPDGGGDSYDPAVLSEGDEDIKMRPPPHELESSGAAEAPGELERTPPSLGAAKAHSYRLKIGDPVGVILRGIPQPISFEDTVDPDGTIKLDMIGNVPAEGKTGHELEQIIHDTYVPNYYRYLSVTVIVPVSRTYFVRGEVLRPGQFPYAPGQTLLQAISSALGFNDFANKKKIKILRGGKTSTHNAQDMEKHPDRDIPIEPGDIIIVPRSIWG
jgi:polysaccharide export outer membrane protein